MKELSADMMKCVYRGNLTFSQAALYMAIGIDKIKLLVDKGELGTVKVFGDSITIPKTECDRFLNDNITYNRNSKVDETLRKLTLATGGK